MTNEQNKKAASGAEQVEEQEHLASGTEIPETSATEQSKPSIEGESTRTQLGRMTLSMFTKGQYVRVRVGDAHNSTELYEHAFDSADEANTALLEAGILTPEQVPDATEPAGTGIILESVTAEQLEEAGLKRHLGSSL